MKKTLGKGRSPADAIRDSTTRRRFLEQLGVVGGSSLLMTALASWDLMAGQAGTRPALRGRPAKSRVLILGAGVSGLVIGYELAKLGYDFRILEARDRVGGLAWTVRRGSEHAETSGDRQVCAFAEGQYVNVGPWRIPFSHTGILDYCRELGVALELFVNESDQDYFYYEGDAVGPLANRRVRLREVKADLVGYTNELLVKAIDQRALELPLSTEDRDRFARYLVVQGYLDTSARAYKAFVDRGPGDPHALVSLLRSGFGNRLRSVPAIDGITAAPMFQPVGGMDRIPSAFAREIGTRRIAFHTEVRHVRQTSAGVTVGVLDTKQGREAELQADYVVVCLPHTVLSGIEINLSPGLAAAVKATTYSNSAKVGLAMKRRFWEEDDRIFGGHLYTNLPLGQFSYPSNDYFTKRGVLLGLYLNGGFDALADQPVAGRVEHVLTHASKVHPQIRREFESAYAVWWRKVKYNLGGFASTQPPARRTQLAQVDNRIVLGSAATAPRSEPDWLEGAVAAGWQAVTSLHERALRA